MVQSVNAQAKAGEGAGAPVPGWLEPATHFLGAMGVHKNMTVPEAVQWLDDNWDDSFLPYFIEASRFNRNPAGIRALKRLLDKKTARGVSTDDQSIGKYIWNRDLENTKGYAVFKRLVLGQVDRAFYGYFDPIRQFDIRLDEVVWGGVKQDGIPPLRNPKMIPAVEAKYLGNSHVVFGIEIEGEARAYPQRILAWHEMFVDTIGGVPLAGVYCTLCGTVILYETEFDGVHHALGTSGFLYRSNKLMYDKATQSLWSTMVGKPVIGPLAGQGIQLRQRSIVTTTWGAWKARHPNTQVLSLDTGHDRDYGEGIAYHNYFSTDKLMFATPFEDKRLSNKAEVLALRFIPDNQQQVAIFERFLRKHPIYENEFSGHSFVVLTDKSGANRVYERPAALKFKSWDKNFTVIDQNDVSWTLSESQLEQADGTRLKRLPAHRAFWFGWFAAYPDTLLVH